MHKTLTIKSSKFELLKIFWCVLKFFYNKIAIIPTTRISEI